MDRCREAGRRVTDNELVIHAFSETPEVLTAALRVARHSVDGLGTTATVRIVVQGGAVHGLAVGAAQEDDLLATISGSGVEVLACENSMSRTGMDPSTLLPQVHTVPAAVTYLTQRQWAGAAYVRI
jgi:intracellular sulfur oxidation DsrE/DsrF family protein